MRTNVILTINDVQYEILRCGYSFKRRIDSKGRPSSGVMGGDIWVELESEEKNKILSQMLLEKAPPVKGSISVLSGADERCIRKIVFEKAYVYSHTESFTKYSPRPIMTGLRITPVRMDIGETVKIDRRWPETYGFHWVGYKKEEVKHVKATPQSPPTPLVTAVKGENTAFPNAEIEYNVTNFNITVSQSDKDRVKWMVEIDGKQELQKQQGEKIKLTIKQEWIGKEITVMPYLKKPNPDVSVKTKVEKFKKTVFFARSRNWAGKTIGGEKKEDMMYNDKKSKDLLVINKLFAIQLKSTDDQLFADMALLFSAGTLFGGSENAKALLAHFKGNTGSVFSSAYMNEKMKTHPTFQEFVYGKDGVLEILSKKLRDYSGNINKMKLLYQGEINSKRIKFNTLNDKLTGMTIAVDDTSAYQVYVDDYKLYPQSIFSCTLRIVVYDHFGLDQTDVEKFSFGAGFRAWYVLQHIRGYKPFLTSMECIIPIDKLTF